MATTKLTVRIAPETRAKVDAIAAELDRSRSWVINEAVRQYFEGHAWMTEAITAAVRDADDDGVFSSHEEVMRGIDEMIADAERA